jgi:hypothetical protein
LAAVLDATVRAAREAGLADEAVDAELAACSLLMERTTLAGVESMLVWRCIMRAILILGGMLALGAVPASSAFAAGCVKGAVVGGILGHVAGHHGVAGAAVGCAVGHHDAERQDRYDHDRYSRDDDRDTRRDPR